jgi:hypothetical protein
VAKLVDAQDLKSCSPQGECRFDSDPRYSGELRMGGNIKRLGLLAQFG